MPDRNPYEHYDIKPEEESPEAWAEALKELEQWDRKLTGKDEPAPAPVETPAPAEPKRESGDDRPMTRYEELCRTPSMKMEEADLDVLTDFSEIIARVNEAQRLLEALRREYPNYSSDRMFNLWMGNLRDTSQVMLREFQTLRNGRQQKQYDRRCVCRKCQSVFLMPVPGGVCDECRAAEKPRVTEQQPPAQ